MREQIISLIVAEENVEKIYKSNKILLDELLKKFTKIHILNLYNLKFFNISTLI